jgi:hypothetical protein
MQMGNEPENTTDIWYELIIHVKKKVQRFNEQKSQVKVQLRNHIRGRGELAPAMKPISNFR